MTDWSLIVQSLTALGTIIGSIGGGYYLKKIRPRKLMREKLKHQDILTILRETRSVKSSVKDIKEKVDCIDDKTMKFIYLFRYKAEMCKNNPKDKGYVALFNSLFPDKKV